MSEEDSHGAPEKMDHGVPALRELRPSTRMFLYIVAVSLPILLIALYLITDPAQGPSVGSRPSTQFWMIGLFLLMIPAGLLMVAAVYQSAAGHDEDQGH